MKAIILIQTAIFVTLGSYAQGTIDFDNNIPGWVVTHVYLTPEFNGNKHGNGPNDFLPGTQDYSGMLLAEGAGFSAQLWAAPGQSEFVPVSSLLPASPVTTFQTGANAGFVVPVTATLAGVPADAPFATIQLRVWYNDGGWVHEWATGFYRGASAPFTVANIGGINNPPPALVGLESFSMWYEPVPEPSSAVLAGLGAFVLHLARRNRRNH